MIVLFVDAVILGKERTGRHEHKLRSELHYQAEQGSVGVILWTDEDSLQALPR